MLYLLLMILDTGSITMIENSQIKNINEAQMIAAQLSELLRDDAFYRLRLKKEYSPNMDPLKWTENVYTRCQLAEALCRKLDVLNRWFWH